MQKKISDWLYKTFLRKTYLRLKKEENERGYRNGFEDARLSIEIENMKRAESWLVDPNKVFSTMPNGSILLDGEIVTAPQLKSLKSEVRAFMNFQIYGIIMNSIRKMAIDKAVLGSTDLYSQKGNEQVLAGKMMVWNLDIIKTIIEKIDSAKIK